jgi:hypothetical protein
VQILGTLLPCIICVGLFVSMLVHRVMDLSVEDRHQEGRNGSEKNQPSEDF